MSKSEMTINFRERLDRLAPVEFKLEDEGLSRDQRLVFTHLVQAADHIDEIFWNQTCPSSPELRKQFDSQLSSDKRLNEYFSINYGPYDRFADNEPFLPVHRKPIGAGFYPTDLSKKELLRYLAKHEIQRESIQSPYTIVQRVGKDLSAVPYHVAFAGALEKAATALLSAAKHEKRRAMSRYLSARASALRNDDYYESDLQWIDLVPNGLDVVIGPYEVYEDGLMGVKAAYEAMITFQDPEDAAQVSQFVSEAAQFHDYLTRSLNLKFEPPGPTNNLVVANLLYSSGDARKGIPAIAFTLPNDERVIEEKGTKEVILKNVLEAKFRHILLPICNALGETTDAKAALSGYVQHTVLHEILSFTRTSSNSDRRQTYDSQSMFG